MNKVLHIDSNFIWYHVYRQSEFKSTQCKLGLSPKLDQWWLYSVLYNVMCISQNSCLEVLWHFTSLDIVSIFLNSRSYL